LGIAKHFKRSHVRRRISRMQIPQAGDGIVNRPALGSPLGQFPKSRFRARLQKAELRLGKGHLAADLFPILFLLPVQRSSLSI
jgi:hypothetical protein